MKITSVDELVKREIRMIDEEIRRAEIFERNRPLLERELVATLEKTWLKAEKNVGNMIMESSLLKDALIKKGLNGNGLWIKIYQIPQTMRSWPINYFLQITLGSDCLIEFKIPLPDNTSSLPDFIKVAASEMFDKLSDPTTAIPLLLRQTV